MNFKVGDEVYVKVQVERVEDNHTRPYLCITERGYAFRAREDELFSTFSEPVEPKIEPCSFCGTGDEDIVCEKNGAMWRVICTSCGYHSISCFDKSEAIEAHNEIARKVRA